MILKKKEIGQTVSNRFKATPYLFKFKPFSHLENCQTVANRFAKILEILVAKPSNRHEPPRQCSQTVKPSRANDFDYCYVTSD